MTTLRTKIKSPSLNAKIVEPINAPIRGSRTPSMTYQASSLSPFLSTNIAWFLPVDLSKINNIFTIQPPIKNGQTIFRNRQTEQTIPLFLNGNKSEDILSQTHIYTINTNCVGCEGCILYFTYEDEYGNGVSDNIGYLESKTICSSITPIILDTSTCTGVVTISDKCNILSPSISENNQILYIDNGRKYQLLSSRNESKNYGWQPTSNDELFPYVERSDFDSFDFPQVTIRGVRKIPATTADTLCGPVTYTGYTYDRMNYNWFFGNNAGITFNPIQVGATPTPLSGAMVSQEGVASISNQEGQLLFYTNGETVYTSGHTVRVMVMG